MSQNNGMNRRHFLRNSALGVVGAGVAGAGHLALAEEKQEKQAEMPKIKAYRTLGRTGFNASDISSGGPQNLGVLNALLDAGVNYIDTAESYVNGQSEIITGQALKNRDRKKFFVTTKLVVKDTDTKETILNRCNKCLERLDLEYVDCMMMHSAPLAESVKNEHFHAAMDQLKAEKKIRFVGLSNHGPQWKDDVDPMEKVLMAAIADGRYDVFLLVYNFLNKDAAERVINACKEKNIGVTLMKTNPVGGYLGLKERADAMKKEGKTIPPYYENILKKLKAKADQAEGFVKKHNLQNPTEIRNAAIKFVLNNPGVATVCCSLVNFDQVEGFVRLSGCAVTPVEKKKLSMYKEGCGSLYCRHACGACEPSCPHGVPVNTIMRYNHYFEAQGREKHAMQKYAALKTAKADKCMTCTGACEAVCPYDVPVHGLLTLAHDRLTLV